MRTCTWFGRSVTAAGPLSGTAARSAIALLVGVAIFAGPAPAQDEEDASRRGRGDRPAEASADRTSGPPPLVAALDKNRDGRLDPEEIEGATAALRSLDRDEDGELTRDEMMPRFGRGPAARRGDGQRPRRGDQRRRSAEQREDRRGATPEADRQDERDGAQETDEGETDEGESEEDESDDEQEMERDEQGEDERRLLRRDEDRPGLRERLRQRRDRDRARRFGNRRSQGGFLFQLLDADDDQQLTKEEVRERANLAVAKIFELVDENEDETLDPDELGNLRGRRFDRGDREGPLRRGDEDAYDSGEAEIDVEIGEAEQAGETADSSDSN